MRRPGPRGALPSARFADRSVPRSAQSFPPPSSLGSGRCYPAPGGRAPVLRLGEPADDAAALAGRNQEVDLGRSREGITVGALLGPFARSVPSSLIGCLGLGKARIGVGFEHRSARGRRDGWLRSRCPAALSLGLFAPARGCASGTRCLLRGRCFPARLSGLACAGLLVAPSPEAQPERAARHTPTTSTRTWRKWLEGSFGLHSRSGRVGALNLIRSRCSHRSSGSAADSYPWVSRAASATPSVIRARAADQRHGPQRDVASPRAGAHAGRAFRMRLKPAVTRSALISNQRSSRKVSHKELRGFCKAR